MRDGRGKMTSQAGSGGVESATLVVEPDPAAVRQARAFVRSRCRAAGIETDACENAVLLTSETVTNAFTHGRSGARITVTIGTRAILVEVGDDNSRHPQRVEQDADALDGRGLAIMDILAGSWGVRDDRYGKIVWFEILLGAVVGTPSAAG